MNGGIISRVGPRAATAFVAIHGDFSPLNKQLSNKIGGLDRKLIKAGLVAGAALGGAIAVGAAKAVEDASDLNESVNKATATFEKSAPKIQKWSKTTADALGLARQEALEGASSVGAMLKPMGIAPDLAAKMSKRMVRLASDMASFNNEDPTDMLDRIRAGLTGEAEPLKKFGSVLLETRVKQFAWKTGIAETGKELTEQQKILARYKLLLTDTKDQTGDFTRTADGLANVKRRLNANVKDLSGSLGMALLPTVKDVAGEVNHLAGDLSRLAARKDLDMGEKLARGFKIAKRDLRPLFDEIRGELEDARIGEHLADAISTATPIIADAAAKAAPRAAKAFADAWVDSSAWGRLAIGAVLVSKMGGIPAITKAGTSAGNAAGAGMLGGLTSKLKGKGGLVGLAALVAAVAGPDLVKVFTEHGDMAKFAGKEYEFAAERLERLQKAGNMHGLAIAARDARFTAKNLGEAGRPLDQLGAHFEGLAARSRKVTNEFGRMRSGAVLNVKELRKVTASNFANIEASMGLHSRHGKDAVEQNFKLGLRVIRGFMKDGTLSTRQGGKEIARLLKVHSGAGKESLKTNFKEARDFIAKTMRNSKGITGEGMKAIRRIFAQELKLYGLSDEAIKFRLQGKEQSGKTIGAPLVNKQRGGKINVGAPSGDSVPAMLERGEYVLNRKAVKRLGVAALDRLNFAHAPRFQAGGMVDPAWDPGTEMLAASISGRVGAWAKRYRANMTAGYDPGGGHVSPGHNVTGTATDMVPLGGDWDLLEKGLRVLVNAGLKVLYGSNGIGMAWPNHGRGNHAHIEWGGAAGLPSFDPKIARVLIGGPDSPLKAIAQGALDRTRKAAQHRLNDLVGAAFLDGTGGVGAAGGDFNKAQLKALWIRAGGDPSQANLMAAIALAESGGNSQIVNSIGATGLWQIHPGGSQYLDPLTNARTAVAKYNSQGLGAWEAYTNGNYRQFLKKGGLAGRMHHILARIGTRKKHGTELLLNRKQRGKLLGKFLKRIQGIGLPKELEGKIKSLTRDADVFGDFAQRASSLTTQDANGNDILGMVNGKDEAGWLGDQLTALFQLRNKLIKAQEIVVRKRDAMTKLIEQAQARLGKVADAIRKAARQRADLQAQLEKAQKKPKQNADLIKSLKGKIRAIDSDQAIRVRERKILHDRLLPALGGKRSKLNTARGDILSSIEDVQGIGSPMERMRSLPATGVLGGQILDVQLRLRDLGLPATATDTSNDSERASILEGLLREANLRTAVSERQFDVFKNMPPFGGSFATGGVVPGPPGAARTIIAHGGETVVPEGAGAQTIQVVVLDGAVDPNKIRVIANDEVNVVLRGQARRAGRGLAGRGGGL